MGKLYFPQLLSGAVAQYPIRKLRFARTIKNVLPDGSMILYPDPDAARLVWELSYKSLSTSDAGAIQTHFNACVGPFHAFTFIDPTENMLLFSSDLRAVAWENSSVIELTPGAGDPDGGSAAFIITNRGQSSQEIRQSLPVPANYQYCFSLYASSAQNSTITLIRRGNSTEQSTTVAVGPSWSRVVSSGRLDDHGANFTVAISFIEGQQLQLYGVQLEAQVAPSRFRPTTEAGGIFPNAHWAVDRLTVIADAPNLYSTSFTIEAAI
jgi:hypothetical protein